MGANTNISTASNPVTAKTASLYPHQRTKILDAIGNTVESIGNSAKSINDQTRKVADSINKINLGSIEGQVDEETYLWVKERFSNDYVGLGVYNIKSSIDGVTDSIRKASQDSIKSIEKTFQPYSSFVGGSLGTLTGIARDPIGGIMDLPATIGNMMDKRNPGLKAKYSATLRKLKLDKLAEMPANIAGSLRNLVSIVDGVLAIPFGFLNDIYVGLMSIMNAINDLVNELFTIVQEYFESLLNILVPGLTDFLDAVTDLAGELSGIASIFAGTSQITSAITMFSSYTNQLNSFISNPLDLAIAYLPNDVKSGLQYLQFPEQIINQALPPQLSEMFQSLGKINGLGFNGNMGYSVGSFLEAGRTGILSSILGGFGAQFSILAPIVGAATPQRPQSFPAQAQNVQGYGYTPNGTPINVNRTPVLLGIAPQIAGVIR